MKNIVIVKFQNDLNRIQRLQVRIKNKIDVNLKSLIEANIDNVSEHIKYLIYRTEENLSNRIKHDIGNCYFMPRAIEIAKEKACIRMPFLLVSTYTSFMRN